MLAELLKTLISIKKGIVELDIKSNFEIECLKVRFKFVTIPNRVHSEQMHGYKECMLIKIKLIVLQLKLVRKSI